MVGFRARVDGPIVMIGYGSIGKGVLPLILKHIDHDPSRITVIDPVDHHDELSSIGVRFIKHAITKDDYKRVLEPLITQGDGRGLCVNLSVDVGSLDVMKLCRAHGVLYIDTVIEPWPGWYFDDGMLTGDRTNYALREGLMEMRRNDPRGSTAVSCCGANPGMVSWLVKQALLNIKADLGFKGGMPTSRQGWAALARNLGIKGIHIAERDTQKSKLPKAPGEFVNTWSVPGFISEGMQPAELGWGTHEKHWPDDATDHGYGCGAAIYLNRPGADTRVRTWTPTVGPHFGFLVTHNEAISISDYLTVRDSNGNAIYRPTCHYAYHPCDDAILSLHELFGNGGNAQPKQRILEPEDITDGMDELGVLLYGHSRNAYWYGSQLTIGQATELIPRQNATGLQVSSAVLAGIIWAVENPDMGIVEADDMDHARCLEIQTPYLGNVFGRYTAWTPLSNRVELFGSDTDTTDAWQFKNVLVR